MVAVTSGTQLGWPVSQAVYDAFVDEYGPDKAELRFQVTLAMRSWMSEDPEIDADSDTPTHLFGDDGRKKKTDEEDKTQIWLRVPETAADRFRDYVNLVGLASYGDALERALREHLTEPVYPDLAQPDDAEFEAKDLENTDDVDDPIEALPDESDVVGETVKVASTFDRQTERAELGDKTKKRAARIINHILDEGIHRLSRDRLKEICVDLDIGRGDGPPSDPTVRRYMQVVTATLGYAKHPIYEDSIAAVDDQDVARTVQENDRFPHPDDADVWTTVHVPGPVFSKYVRYVRDDPPATADASTDDAVMAAASGDD